VIGGVNVHCADVSIWSVVLDGGMEVRISWRGMDIVGDVSVSSTMSSVGGRERVVVSLNKSIQVSTLMGIRMIHNPLTVGDMLYSPSRDWVISWVNMHCANVSVWAMVLDSSVEVGISRRDMDIVSDVSMCSTMSGVSGRERVVVSLNKSIQMSTLMGIGVVHNPLTVGDVLYSPRFYRGKESALILSRVNIGAIMTITVRSNIQRAIFDIS